MTIPKMPKQFWDDVEWARNHHTEFLKKYRNKWIVVVNKKIISAGNNLDKIEKIAKQKTGKKMVFSMFVDGGEHIYGSC